MEKSLLPTSGRCWSFDAELLRRHDRPGPHYTSYPTAPNFHPGFAAHEFARVAKDSNVGAFSRQLSLYVLAPFCRSPCFQGDCNRRPSPGPVAGESYLALLQQEIARVACLFDPDREVIQVHLGAGVSDFLVPALLGRFLAVMHRLFRFSERPERDICIELEPCQSTPQDIAALARMGFNRASLRVRDLDPLVQAAINRVQGVTDTLAILQACRRHGLRSVKVDLMLGLPRQSLQGFGHTLDILLAARPERIAMHEYMHQSPRSNVREQIDAHNLPGTELKLALLGLAVERLSTAGYVYLGMDHFVLPDDDLAMAQRLGGLHRNVIGYSAHADTDLIGLGVGAISHVGDSFSQSHHEFAQWAAAIAAGELPMWRGLMLEADDVLRADVIQRLMCRGEVEYEAVERAHSIVFLDYFKHDIDALAPMVREGLAQVLTDRIRVTSRGRGLLRSMAMCFDRYLPKPDLEAKFLSAI